jgi:hypothetical protein
MRLGVRNMGFEMVLHTTPVAFQLDIIPLPGTGVGPVTDSRDFDAGHIRYNRHANDFATIRKMYERELMKSIGIMPRRIVQYPIGEKNIQEDE